MTAKLSVWLVPIARDDSMLQRYVERLAAALGSPAFPPHVTMCSDPAVTTLTAVGPAADLRLSLGLDALSFGDDYFHGCYLTASDHAPASRLQQRCAATLGAKVPENYPPHLSLAYGVFDDTQRATAQALVTDLPVHVTFDRLELWATDGPVSSWRKLI
jgi:hypothetical protein